MFNKKNSNKIITDQKLFFNMNAKKKITEPVINKLFTQYVNQVQLASFDWLKNSRNILDYGCGTGHSINLFLKNKNPNKYNIYGADIAEDAIEQVKNKYRKFKFYTINKNRIPQIKNNSLDAVMMCHILHHSHNHLDIFKEIYSKLKKNGKFLIIDLSSRNFFVKLGRSLFLYLPLSMKNKFNDDLVIDGHIPEKYNISVAKIIYQLKQVGFSIEVDLHSHLFFFVFGWIDRFIPLSKNKIILHIYKKLINLEKFLLKYNFFKQNAEMFHIRCIKK